MIWQVLVIALLSYLIGSINPAIILSNILKKEDIRTQGSGNAGTTNTLRTLGKWPAVAVLLVDILKAVIAISLARWIGTLGNYTTEEFMKLHDYALLAAGIGVVLGHNFPIYYGFKGGKGVATSLGILLIMEWKIGIICLVFALAIILASRMVSLGSITAAILYPVLVLLMPGTAFNDRKLYLLFAIFLTALLIIRHKANIKRLLEGTENKLWKTKSEKSLK
ncbi:MAG: glycerol-3-phosphate 1-O-acyltransferase PlsY [Clostridia bacterium]|nr:glycerol-3-phosphate 1-O-acyltransferase PlsY [Clostridia bacterium]